MLNVKAVVLAAGLSKRMGRNKLTANLNGMPVICHLLTNISKSIVSDITVVTGHMAQKTEQVIAGFECRTVYNANFKDGMGSSIATGVRAVMEWDSLSGAALIFNGDMPFIKTETVNNIIFAYQNTGTYAVVPYCDGKRGHPDSGTRCGDKTSLIPRISIPLNPILLALYTIVLKSQFGQPSVEKDNFTNNLLIKKSYR